MNKLKMMCIGCMVLFPIGSYASDTPQDIKLWNTFDAVLSKCGAPSIDINNNDMVVWSYNYNKYAYHITFNKDGRVIEVQCIGKQIGRISNYNITLGDSVKRVYDTYGWPNKTTKSNNTTKIVYNIKHNFSLIIDKDKNKRLVVKGIIIETGNDDINT